MKKTYFIIILLAAIFSLSTVSFSANNKDITVKIDGLAVVFPDAKPYIKNSRTLIPIRFISENMGAKVEWKQAERTVSIVKDDKEIFLIIGSKSATVNQIEKTFDVPAEINNSRTFVPLRFVSETLGAKVDWDGQNRIVNITTNKNVKTEVVNGYTTPTQNNTQLLISPEDDLTSKGDLDIIIVMDKPLDAQYKDLESILLSKFNSDSKTITEFVNYVKTKSKQSDQLEFKKFKLSNGQVIIVASGYGVPVINISVLRKD